MKGGNGTNIYILNAVQYKKYIKAQSTLNFLFLQMRYYFPCFMNYIT